MFFFIININLYENYEINFFFILKSFKNVCFTKSNELIIINHLN